MDENLLQDIGLTKAQASAYIKLVRNGGYGASALARAIGESRTNAYKILDKLCVMGLTYKDDSQSKIHYYAHSPAALERLLQAKSEAITTQTRQLHAVLPNMLSFFFAHSEQPAIRYFQGKDGLERVFADMLHTAQPIYLLRSPADTAFYDEAFFADFRKKRALLGIVTYALTPDLPDVNHDSGIDKQNRFIRQWIAPEAYNANVEWDIYGDKLALISYGQEAMGIVIESPQIADSARQVFGLLWAAS